MRICEPKRYFANAQNNSAVTNSLLVTMLTQANFEFAKKKKFVWRVKAAEWKKLFLSVFLNQLVFQWLLNKI